MSIGLRDWAHGFWSMRLGISLDLNFNSQSFQDLLPIVSDPS